MQYKKTLLILIFIIAGMVSSSYAATRTWTNGSGDQLASTAANWSGAEVPQDGDWVIFDSSSIDDCVCDLSVTLDNIDIESGYNGSITISSTASLTLDKTIAWTGQGINNLASNQSNWSGNAVPNDGDKIVFNDSSSRDCTWDISISPTLFSTSSAYTGTLTLNTSLSIAGNLTIAKGTVDLNNNALMVYGYVLIGTNGTLNATSSTIEVKGDWANGGSFSPGISTVILSGIGQTIYGDTTFYNFIKTVTAADTLYFEAGSTQTVVQSLTLRGFATKLLSLRSTLGGSYWNIDPQGTSNISYTSIMDMNNINFVNVVPLNSVDDGHNDDVSFGGSECAYFDNRLILARVFYSEGRGV